MSTSTFTTIIAFLLFILIVSPIFTIMSLNALFGTNIDLTVWTWLSVAWLTAVFTPKPSYGSK